MSPLADAVDAINTAIYHLEQAEPTVPAYQADGMLRFLRAELKVVIRRLGNLRKVVGDLDDPPDPGDSISGSEASP